MARCTATPPCDYKLNGEVHDPGCPARRGAFSDPEAAHLYATETAAERGRLQHVLEELLDRDLLDTPGYAGVTADDVTGGEAEWLAIRRVIRADQLTDDQITDGFRLNWDDEVDAPALQITA